VLRGKGKGPTTPEETADWKKIEATLSLIAIPLYEAVMESGKCTVLSDGTILYEADPISHDKGIYSLEKDNEMGIAEWIKIGCSIVDCLNRAGKQTDSPKSKSNLVCSLEEWRAITDGCEVYKKGLEEMLRILSGYQHEESRAFLQKDRLEIHIAELFFASFLVSTRETALTLSVPVGLELVLESVFALGSPSLRNMCKFQDGNANRGMIDLHKEADDMTAVFSWITYISRLDGNIEFLMTLLNDDDKLNLAIKQFYRGRPPDKFILLHMIKRVFNTEKLTRWVDSARI
jgi:hypothetical protein